MIGNTVGSYKITDKIGEGGMGAVFKGIDLMLEREVAIKMLRPELASQPDVVERFRAEAVTLAKLNHPNIATLYSFLRQGEDFFMVMEFVRGETLDSLIKRAGAMPCDRAIGLFCQALEGIDHAHRMGIIHRDVKPANMMLTETGALKVMDFGIARVLGTSRLTKQGNIIGTIAYMSPEQVRGIETDARSDIYSLGILLYEMLTGRVPFASDSEYDLMKMQIEDAPAPPRVFSAQIPQGVEQAIMRSLAKRAEARFQGAAEFRNALLSSTGTAAAPTIATAPVAPPPTRVSNQAVTNPISDQPKETRLASGGALAWPSEQVKPTRLADDATPPNAYVAFQPPASTPAPKKSNVALFVAIAAVLVVVIVAGVAVFMFTGGTKSSVSPSPATVQPAVQSASPTPQPSTGERQTPPPIQTPAPNQPTTQIGPDSPQTATAESPAAPKPAATKVAKTRKDTEADAARKEKERKAAEARRLLNQ
jgi:serine/threonine-protein kinase